MNPLRVLIVSDGKVVDVHDLDDPRIRYIEAFNQLNQSTPYQATLDVGTPVAPGVNEIEPTRILEPCETGPRDRGPHRACSRWTRRCTRH